MITQTRESLKWRAKARRSVGYYPIGTYCLPITLTFASDDWQSLYRTREEDKRLDYNQKRMIII